MCGKEGEKVSVTGTSGVRSDSWKVLETSWISVELQQQFSLAAEENSYKHASMNLSKEKLFYGKKTSSVVADYFAQGYKVQLHYMLYLYLVLKRNQRSP